MPFSRRSFIQGAVQSGIALGISSEILPADAQNAPSAAPSAAPHVMVDPDLAGPLKQLPPLHLNQSTLPAIRSAPMFPPLPAPAPQPVEQYIPGPAGAPRLRLVIVDPAPGTKNKPALLHIHGGGYIAGKAGQDPVFLQTAAQQCGCYVVSVDYRLAPETKFPGSLEDNYTALRWLHDNAEKLGVDRTRIAVGGESAGGGHAAALAIAARDRGEIPVVFQLLIYPMLDDRTGSTRAVAPCIGTYGWTAESNRFGWTSLLGVPAGSGNVPAGAVPARVKNLAGLPPAFIAVGSIDLFVDEDIDYARRLIDACVPTELHVFPGAYHGFNLLCPDAPVTREFNRLWIHALRRGLKSA